MVSLNKITLEKKVIRIKLIYRNQQISKLLLT
ncbi:hypothetical protein BVZ82_00381 [Haemophilus influenzae]|nr:hypothetical protein BVZ82_00381 [Haemophilus influenzae]PRJ61343.1 hypothetical protein BV107_01119 [Haemophilus influenzae]PRJ65860.1 hypothetical protein BV108_00138 [Haemophilus influenzae]PRL00619.1 hypothetical protein BV132_01299 [Haemophilus influenzae]